MMCRVALGLIFWGSWRRLMVVLESGLFVWLWLVLSMRRSRIIPLMIRRMFV